MCIIRILNDGRDDRHVGNYIIVWMAPFVDGGQGGGLGIGRSEERADGWVGCGGCACGTVRVHVMWPDTAPMEGHR